MKYKVWMVLLTALFFSLACSITLPVNWTRGEIGEIQTLAIAETVETNESIEILIEMGAGRLEVQGGSNYHLEGEVQYNVVEWQPTISKSSSSIGISQDVKTIPIEPDEKIINTWNLRLGKKTPIDLTIRAGAYDGNLDLSGVPLNNLDIQDGASNSKIVFNLKNPVQMETLRYKTGASNVEISGIANANVDKLFFSGGAGKAILDFSGQLDKDIFVEINGGVGSIQIVVPEGTHCILRSNGEIVNVFNRGDWTENGDIYETGSTGPLIEIEVNLSIGSLELLSE